MSTPDCKVPPGDGHADHPALRTKEEGGTMPPPQPSSLLHSSSGLPQHQQQLGQDHSMRSEQTLAQQTYIQMQTQDEQVDTSQGMQKRPSPSTHFRDLASGRQLSPLPTLMPRNSLASGHGSLEAAGISHFGRKPLSPRLLARKSASGEASLTTLSLDSEQTRTAAEQRRERVESDLQQQSLRSGSSSSCSIDGQPFRRWGPLISPHMVHRLRESYVPGTQPVNNEARPVSVDSRPASRSASLQLPKIQSLHSMEVDQTEQKATTSPPRLNAEAAFLKRKPEEDDRDSPFAFSVPPSSFDERCSERAAQGSEGVRHHQQQQQQSRQQQQQRPLTPDRSDRPAHHRSQYEFEASPDMNQQERELAMSQGRQSSVAGAIIPQRKSCDRCFKMKTKCSRAAPGAPGDAPCDGCIRRGFGDSCHTSRPDYPFPRISLSKRQRRESSLPDFNDASASDSSLYLLRQSNMGPGDTDWRSKLIDNSPRKGEEPHQAAHRQQHERVMAHNFSYAPYAPIDRTFHSQDERPLRAQQQGGEHVRQSPPHLDRSLRQSSSSGAPRDGQLGDGHGARHQRFVGPNRLPTSEMRGNVSSQDFDAAQTERHLRTPVVPSSSSLAGIDGSQTRAAQLHPVGAGGSAVAPSQQAAPIGVSPSQQAMQNIPMQLLPKAIGIPALEYFDQLIFPFLPLPHLASKLLREQFEAYTKPGRNNIIEIVMAIGLQLQGALLSCSDKGQASIVEGRIFKVFLRADGKRHSSDAGEGMTIDSVKNWIEPSRHRNRAKDIVKLVCMRRCLKYGLDYDDVLENVLLAYFHLIRGDSASVYMLSGDAQRQLTLLQIQGNSSKESDAWTEASIETLRAIVQSLNSLQPIALFSGGYYHHHREEEEVSAEHGNDGGSDQVNAPTRCDDLSMMTKLAKVADAIKRGKGGGDERMEEDEVDRQIAAIQDSLPSHMQVWLHDQRINSISFKGVTDEKWVSDMVTRGSNTAAPLFRLRGVMITNYLRIVARQHHCIRLLAILGDESKGEVEEEEDDATSTSRENPPPPLLPLGTRGDDPRVVPIRHLLDISSAMLASVHLAFTIFPHLTSLSQAFAGEMSAAFWSYIVCHLILGSMGKEKKTGGKNVEGESQSQHESQSETVVLDKIEDCLSIILANLTSSKEKESWPFAPSLHLAKKAIAGLRASDKTANELLALFIRFSSASPTAMSRMLQGDPGAATQIGRGLHSHIEAANQRQL